MVNCTTDIMEGCTFNLTQVADDSIILQPQTWLALINNQLGGWLIVGFMITATIILFNVVRRVPEVDETAAAVYSGVIMSIFGILLFTVNTSVTGLKLFEWEHLSVIIIMTGVAIAFNYMNRRS